MSEVLAEADATGGLALQQSWLGSFVPPRPMTPHKTATAEMRSALTGCAARGHFLTGASLTYEVRQILSSQPDRWFRLVDIMEALPPGPVRSQVYPILVKMLQARQIAWTIGHTDIRVVKKYRWVLEDEAM